MDERVKTEIAKVIAADSDLKTELNIPDGCEVHFYGAPILALNPETNNSTVPAHFLSHPLVADRYFFSLPRALWDQVHNPLGPASFDAEIVALEDALGELCGDHSARVGFWRGRPVAYDLLRRSTGLQLSARSAQSVGMDANQAKLDHTMRIYEERAESLSKVSRAYLGWLLTNRQFLNEHDAMFHNWEAMVERWGLDRLGILLPKGTIYQGEDPTFDPGWSEYRSAFEDFFIRWRLQGLAAPYLPIPLRPLMGGQFPVSILPQIMRAGGVFVLPDTFPIPSRDSLRGMLDDSLHGQRPAEHLAEWMRLIASDNSAKQSLLRFARIFELQHYWRILQNRHHQALQRKATRLKQMLAAFLSTSERTIHLDLIEIGRRLGADWEKRGNTLPLGPF